MKKVICAISALLLVAAPFVQAQNEVLRRGIMTPESLFINKGSIGAGLSFSYNTTNVGNYEGDNGFEALFSLVSGMHGSINSFSINPSVSYFVADNVSVGLTMGYSKSELALDGLDLSISDDLTFSLEDFHFRSQGYHGGVTIRNYMPIADSKTFSLFTEFSAIGQYTQSKNYKLDSDEDKIGTYQDMYKLRLGLSPGACVFISDNVAFEFSVGLAGIDFQKIVQTTNQVEVSTLKSSSARAKVNLLQINIGTSVYIPIRKSK